MKSKLEQLEDALNEAYEEALEAEGRAAEAMTVDALSEEKQELLWALYEQNEGLVVDAAQTARRRVHVDLEPEDAVSAAKIYWPYLLAKVVRSSWDGPAPKKIWTEALRAVQDHIYRNRHQGSAGGSQATRALRRHDGEVEDLPVSEAVDRLREKYSAVANLKRDTAITRLRMVRQEADNLSLQAPASRSEGEFRLVDVIGASQREQIEPRRLGELLAERLSKQRLWERLMTANRSADELTEHELQVLDEAPSKEEAAARVFVSVGDAKKLRNERGSSASKHGLCEEQVKEIRRRYANEDVTYADLAGEYEVSKAIIGKAIRHDSPYDYE